MTNALSAYLAGRAAAIAEISAGITTPRHFSDARREHLATRSAAGLFDFSFMGCYEIAGSDSRPFLRAVQTRALHDTRCWADRVYADAARRRQRPQ